MESDGQAWPAPSPGGPVDARSDVFSAGILIYLMLSGKNPFESDSFHVLAGSANFFFPAMLGGSIGGTISLANSFPKIAIDLFECGRARDEARGVPLQEKVTRVNKAISGAYGVAGVKAAMKLGGFKGGIPRRPLLPPTPEQFENLRQMLAGEGMIE